MVDTSRGIGSADRGGSVTQIRETFSRDSRASREAVPIGASIQGASANGPRGRRMLSPDTPLDSLDRFAPRGTYLDILA